MAGELRTVDLGLVEYREAYDVQTRVRAARQAEAIPDVLLTLEHPPVYTRARRSYPGELGMGEAWYRERGIDIVDTDRGGRLTYHGPGQLVGYPIMRIDDVMECVRTMEAAIVAALRDAGLPTARGRSQDGREYTGVWIDERKIASIGLHVSRGVTMHGFAINVDNDLEPFEWVVACGLPDVRMTSVAVETHRTGHFAAFSERVVTRFCEAFDHLPRPMSRAELEAAVRQADPPAAAPPAAARRAPATTR